MNKQKKERMNGMYDLFSEHSEINTYLSSNHDSARNKVHVRICFKPCI